MYNNRSVITEDKVNQIWRIANLPQVVGFDSDRLRLMYKRHDLYCNITGTQISLEASDGLNCTDCKNRILIVLTEPGADLAHRHEWQHIFFKSDPNAGAELADYYLRLVGCPSERFAKESGFIRLLVNALDDIRVNELWRKIFPSSAEEIADRWTRLLIIRLANKIPLPLPLALIAMYLHLPARLDMPSLSDACHRVCRLLGLRLDDLSKAVLSVQEPESPGFDHCLLATRHLLDRIYSLENTCRTFDDGVPLEDRVWSDLESTSSLTSAELRLAKERVDLVCKFHSNPFHSDDAIDFNDRRKNWMAIGDRQIKAIIKQLQALSPIQLNPLVKVRQSLASQRRHVSTSREDYELAIQLRRELRRVQDHRQIVRSSSGSQIDVQACINLYCGGGDQDIFSQEERSPGFYGLLLIDMSSSMKPFWETISRTAAVLTQALKDPHIQLEVWGFQSDKKTVITKFHDLEEGLCIKEEDLMGGTPIARVFHEVSEHLSINTNRRKNVFLITDGYPNVDLDGSSLRALTSTIKERDRLSKIATLHTLLLGTEVVGQELFSGPRTIHLLKPEDLERVLVRMVRQPLLSSLTSHWGKQEKRKMRLQSFEESL